MRRFAANLLSVVIVAVTVLGLIAAAANHTLGDAETVKRSLRGSGIYDTVTPSVLKAEADTQVAGFSLADESIQAAAKAAFTSDYLAKTTAPAIDNTYAWLHGTQDRPDFVINLKEGRDSFGRSIGTLIADRADGLPTCTFLQAAELTQSLAATLRSGEGIGQIPCRPPGVTRALIEQAVSRYVTTAALRNTPIADATIPAKDLLVQGQPFYEQARLRQLPSLVQISQWLPWICFALVLLLLLGIFRLVRSGHKTALRLAVSLVVAGLIGCVLALEARPVARMLSASLANDTGMYQTIAHAGADAVVALFSAFGGWLRNASGVVILIGAGLLIVVQWRTWQRLPAKKPGHKPGTV